MADAVTPSYQLEILALLPTGVTFPEGMANFCGEFVLRLEESEPAYATGSGDDFSFRAKLINSTSSTVSQAIIMLVETDEEYSLQTAREMIEERFTSAFDNIIVLRDSVGESRTLEAYQLLNELENMLRKLVAVRLAALSHQTWWASRVQNCLRRGKGGRFRHEEHRDAEVNDSDITPQNQQDHHDIFYLDLSVLKRIIEDADNWRDGFASDLKVLKNIERLDMFNRLRRKIAHNRFLSHRNLEELRQLHGQLMHLCRRVFNM